MTNVDNFKTVFSWFSLRLLRDWTILLCLPSRFKGFDFMVVVWTISCANNKSIISVLCTLPYTEDCMYAYRDKNQTLSSRNYFELQESRVSALKPSPSFQKSFTFVKDTPAQQWKIQNSCSQHSKLHSVWSIWHINQASLPVSLSIYLFTSLPHKSQFLWFQLWRVCSRERHSFLQILAPFLEQKKSAHSHFSRC